MTSLPTLVALAALTFTAPACNEPVTEAAAPAAAPARSVVVEPPSLPTEAPPAAASADPVPSQDAPPADAPAKTDYAELLAELVTPDGLVRYDRLADPSRLEQLRRVVATFAAAPRPAATTDRLALWSNAYNANVLLMAYEASRRPGFVNVEKVPGFFDAIPIAVAGERLTLNRLENDRIRPLGDARSHAALVCAAMGCPPLRAEPYVAARLDAQFDDQCRRWVNDPTKFRVTDGRVGLSAILEWYGTDFTAAPHGTPLGFVKHYADRNGALGRFLAGTPSPPTFTLPYDWTLNRAG